MSYTCKAGSLSTIMEKRISDFLDRRSGSNWDNKERVYFEELPKNTTSPPDDVYNNTVFQNRV
jgi:hypothetical protein